MKWQPAGNNAYRTDCDRYSVCRVTYVDAKGPQPRWEAWRRRAHPDGPGRIGSWQTQEQARTACEEDDGE